MKEKIKVFLQYPWKYSDSSYYRNLLNNPAEGIEYANEKFKVIDSGSAFNINKTIKEPIRIILKILKIPNITYSRKKADLIHCAHCLSLNKKPWIVDFERYENLGAGSGIADSLIGRNIIKMFLKSKYCKKILPWTFDAKNSLLENIRDEEIENKIELLPFAIPARKFKKKKTEKNKNKGKLTILFVARYFEPKGGCVAVEVIDYLTRKYKNVDGIIVSETPKSVLRKYKKNKKIKFYDLMKQEKLFKEIYSNSDIFFYPGFSDTFGFALVEALAFGLPIITFEGFAREEIVEEGRTGYIIKKRGGDKEDINWRKFRKNMKKEYIKEAIEKTELLINDKSLREKMGKKGVLEIKKGKFSIENRNSILKRIYKQALEV